MKDPLYEAGLKARKQVLGADYVERALKNADEFTMSMQELATRAAWGTVWTRGGLSRRDRSLITLAFALARSKPEELAVHLRGAVRNGVTKTEIRELLLHSAIYCGYPEAMGGFRVAREFFAREGDKMLAARLRGAAKKRRNRAVVSGKR